MAKRQEPVRDAPEPEDAGAPLDAGTGFDEARPVDDGEKTARPDGPPDGPDAPPADLVEVGCSLPNGLVLRTTTGPGGDEETAVLQGANATGIRYGMAVTKIPARIWAAWHSSNEGAEMVRQGLVVQLRR